MSTELIEIIVKAFFMVLTGIISVYVIPIIKKFMEKYWVKIAVQAAEKIYQESGMGEIKYEYVVNFLVKMKIIKLDESGKVPIYWKTLIESTCEELDILWGKIKDEVEISEEEKQEKMQELKTAFANME